MYVAQYFFCGSAKARNFYHHLLLVLRSTPHTYIFEKIYTIPSYIFSFPFQFRERTTLLFNVCELCRRFAILCARIFTCTVVCFWKIRNQIFGERWNSWINGWWCLVCGGAFTSYVCVQCEAPGIYTYKWMGVHTMFQHLKRQSSRVSCRSADDASAWWYLNIRYWMCLYMSISVWWFVGIESQLFGSSCTLIGYTQFNMRSAMHTYSIASPLKF